MASRKFGSRDDLELSPVIRKPGQQETQDSDTESEDLDPPKEVSPMLEKPPKDHQKDTGSRDLSDLYAKPKPKPRKQGSNPNLIQSEHSQDSTGKQPIEPKPQARPRNQSKSSLLKDTGEKKQGIPPADYQPTGSSGIDSPYTRQGEPLYSGIEDINNTGEQADTTSIGEVSQVQQFNFIPTNQIMGEVDEQPSPTGMLGWLGFGCSVFALACLCVSFASPYWMQAYPLSFNQFQNMGLWEVCMQVSRVFLVFIYR